MSEWELEIYNEKRNLTYVGFQELRGINFLIKQKLFNYAFVSLKKRLAILENLFLTSTQPLQEKEIINDIAWCLEKILSIYDNVSIEFRNGFHWSKQEMNRIAQFNISLKGEKL